ncbi:MAG TPA: protein kinase, partial [Kofleriaceae bacterium]|nr:protein kinase [Kofleriaceae bacterium]
AAGGMARIYIGRTTGIGSFERHVVLKLILPERANDVTAVQMFLDEARLAASLNHQNVAQVFEVGEDGGIHYLAMEYVHGQDLRALLAKAGGQGTRIPLELALTVVAGAAAGLNHAHERRAADGTPLGIVHRDVSPSNIMIGYDGSVKLLDFGIAKATSRSVETQSGIIKGKFAYMAPEQCRGRDVDRRSDVFSLGIILYEISTQHRCFRADSDFDTMHRIVTGDVVRPSRLVQGYPVELEAIVLKALAVEAQQRYQSAGLLLEALEAFAVANRYSLSTIGLGRFMRDMFGEITEPWLGAPQNAPAVPRESTISSTDGRSEVGPAPMLPLHDRARTDSDDAIETAVPDGDARYPESAGIAGKAMLDIVHDDTEAPDELATEVLRPSPISPYMHLGHTGAQLPLPAPPLPPSPPPPQAAFPATPGSGSHSSHPAALPLPIASTRHGYASGGAMTAPGAGYPRYEPTGDDVDVQLRPNRKLLFLGIGAALVGLVVIIVLVASGGSKLKDTDGLAVGSDSAGSAEAGSAEAVTPPAPPPIDDHITIHVGSLPKGADVLIAGTKVGVTPFDGKLKRGAAVTTLVVRMAGYADFNSKIDLAGEYSNDKITLAKLEPKPEVKPDSPVATDRGSAEEPKPNATEPKPDTAESKNDTKVDPFKDPKHPTTTTHVATPVVHNPVHNPVPHTNPPVNTAHETPAHVAPPPKPKCQPAGQINPFDTSCNGKACPPCS